MGSILQVCPLAIYIYIYIYICVCVCVCVCVYSLVQAFRLTSNHLYFCNAIRILQLSLEYTIANRNVYDTQLVENFDDNELYKSRPM